VTMRYKTPVRASFMPFEAIADILYDRLPYRSEGSAWAADFFVKPVGVDGKTFLDTNLTRACAIPEGNRFLLTGLEVVFLPAAHLSPAARVADVNAAARSGYVELTLQNRVWLRSAPLASCPASPYWFDEPGEETDEEEAMAREVIKDKFRGQLSEQFAHTDYGAFSGRPFRFIPLWIESSQLFSVRVAQLAPLPSGFDGELWCRLKGKRLVQLS
jgi:hypothetical protein